MASTDLAPIIDGKRKPFVVRPTILTQRQQIFIREWMKHGNGSKAAQAAGYAPATARQMAVSNLKIPKVIAEIERLKGLQSKRYEVTVERVMSQAARMAFVDPREYVDGSGELIPLHELSDEAAAALQGLEVDQGQNGKLKTKYKLVDRGAAVDKLMRHLGLFERDNTQAVDAVGNLLASIHSAGSRIGVK